MSFANKLKGMGETTGGGQMAPMETFCITVTGYENVDAEKEQDRFVIGTRVDTKEEVRVSLRPAKGGLKGTRNDIRTFADYDTFMNLTAEQRKKLGVKPTCAAPGGEIRFDGAYSTGAGSYSARWGVATAHFKGEARSVREFFRIRPPKLSYRDDGTVDKASVVYEVLKTKTASVAASMEDFEQKVLAALKPVQSGNPMVFAVVRIASGDTVVSLEARAQRDETKKDYSYLPAEESLRRFLEVPTRLGKVGDVVREALADAETKVEVIGGTCFNMGRMALAAQVNNGKIAAIDETHRIDVNPERPVNGFVEGWITLRHLDTSDRALVVSHHAYTAAKDQIVPLLPRDVPTANVTPPAPTRLPVQNQAPAVQEMRSAPAPAGGDGMDAMDDMADLDRAMNSYDDRDAGARGGPSF